MEILLVEALADPIVVAQRRLAGHASATQVLEWTHHRDGLSVAAILRRSRSGAHSRWARHL